MASKPIVFVVGE